MNSEYLDLLNFINEHPEQVIQEPTEYANQLTFAFGRGFYQPKSQILFPQMRLHVERLDPNLVKGHYKLFHSFYQRLNSQVGGSFNDVWVTTSDVSNRNLYLVELSFE